MTTNTNARAIADAVAEAQRAELANAARAAMPASEYLDSPDLEQLTGTPASTWRYRAHIGTGPVSFKLGRRRVWKRSTVTQWLESQEKAATLRRSSRPAPMRTRSAGITCSPCRSAGCWAMGWDGSYGDLAVGCGTFVHGRSH